MKNMKKILALVVAALMILSSFAVLAEDGYTGDTPVRVTNLDENDVAHFYQIIEWVGVEVEHNVSGWKAKDPFGTILTEAELTKVLVGVDKATAEDVAAGKATRVGQLINPTGITADMAGDLARAAQGNGTAVTATVVQNTTDAYEAVLTNTEAGIWMALITPADVNTIYNPVFVSADFDTTNTAGNTAATTEVSYSGSAAAKKSTLTLTKTAENAADYNSDNAQTTAVNDIVTYTVNTTIPGYGEVYTNPHFVLKDTLTNLTLQKKSGSEDYDITVSSVDAANYEISATDTGYTITFKSSWLITNKVALPITVVYKAKVNENAQTTTKAINEEDNDVMIEYSHTPTQEDDYDVKKDTTQHYTFTLDAAGMGWGQNAEGVKTSELVKTGVDAAGNPVISKTETSAITNTEKWEGPLKDAQFGLYAKDDPTCVGSPVRTAITGEDGRMTFDGLDAGTYYIKEIQAPTGFVTNNTIKKIVIAAETDTVSVTEWYKDGAWSSSNNGGKSATYETEILKDYSVTISDVDGQNSKQIAHYEFTNESTSNSNEIKWTTLKPEEHPYEFQNVQGVELPHTGGMGTTILYIGGSILVILAAVLLITKRRMNAED